MRIRPWALAAVLVSCAHAQPQPQPKTFSQFADAYFAARFARSPTLATHLGLHQTDGKLEDLSRAAVESQVAELKAQQVELAGIRHHAFVETAKQIDAARTPAEVMKSLSDTHPAPDELIPAVARSVEAARQFVMEKDLVTVPSEVRVRVEPTPPYARSGSFASMDTPGPFETRATEAFYYVTPVEQDWDAKHKEEHVRLYNPWVVGMINVHEAYPGHYLEFLYAPRFPTRTRQLSHASTNSEGWAHYAEQMMVELFREQCFQEPANAFEEARRGAYNSTYLYYTLGKLEIQELARDYLAAKHATLKQFHDAFVAQGALPIPMVRKILLRAP